MGYLKGHWDGALPADWVVGWEEQTIFWSIPAEAGTLMACDRTCAEGSTFGRECFAFIAEHVLDACLLGGILCLNSR